MAFISTTFASRYPPTNNHLRALSNPRNEATIQDGRVTMHNFRGDRVMTDDLDAFDTDYDEAPSTSAVLMAKLYAYDSDFLSKVLNLDTSQDNNEIDQSVHEMQYSEQPPFIKDSYIDITSDSNVISYDQYLKETKNEVVHNTTSSAQQDAMIMFVIKEMSNQVAKCNEVNKVNKTVNESLTTKLEIYKEQVNFFKERQKFDLIDREKYIEGQIRDNVMSDSEDSIVTYTEVSRPFEGLSDIGSSGVEGPPTMPEDPYSYVVAAFQAPPSPDYVPGLKEQAPPLPEFVPESEDLEEDLVDYPINMDDDDDEDAKESFGDEADDDGEDEDKEEDEEYPAPADSIPPPPVHRTTARISIPIQASTPVLSKAKIYRLLAIPSTPRLPLSPWSSPLPQIPSLPFSSITTSACLRFEVDKSSSAPTARPTGGHRADYGFVATLDDEIRRDLEREKMAPKRTIKSTPATTTTTTTTVTDAQLKALIDQGVANSLAARDADKSQNREESHDSGMGVRTQAPHARECTYQDFMKCKPLYFKGTKGVIEFTWCALTWWTSHVTTVGFDVAYAMSWINLRKKMKDKYCPQGKIKKLEVELCNLKVKGTDVVTYNQRFQELALMCARMFPEESDKIERYISGLADMIHESVMASMAKTMQDVIKFTTKMMDKNISTFAEQQAKNKRKFEDTSKNNQN
nr:hypothetical protein [Tanacetum cinerariifolium]